MLYTTGIDTVFFFFPLIGFPNEPAAEIALNTVKSWIEENPDKVGYARVVHIQNKRIVGQLSICAGSVYFMLFLIRCEWR